jgi:hypothetical protein
VAGCAGGPSLHCTIPTEGAPSLCFFARACPELVEGVGDDAAGATLFRSHRLHCPTVLTYPGGWPSLSLAETKNGVPHSSRSVRRVGTMPLAVPFLSLRKSHRTSSIVPALAKNARAGPHCDLTSAVSRAGPPAQLPQTCLSFLRFGLRGLLLLWPRAACGRDDTVHPQVLDHLTVVILRMEGADNGDCETR